MLLAALILLLSLLFVAVWAVGPWQLPQSISLLADAYDAHLLLTVTALGVVFLISQGLLIWTAWRGRRADSSVGRGLPWDLVGGAAAAVVFFGLGAAGLSVDREPAPLEPDLRIEVLAQQFAWNFRYPGPDGIFGRTAPELIDDALANPFGIDREDPSAGDDRATFVLKAPVDAEVELILRTRDVIHSLFVRELRLKQDLLPGAIIRVRFRARRTGTYEIACAELCGLGHHQMRSVLEVLPREEFERWRTTPATR